MDRLKLAACVVFYNDHRSLKRCLDSLAGNVDYVFALDGRYRYLKDDEYFENPLSTDGSRDIVDCYKGQNVYLIDKPDVSESEKRQAYCELCRAYNVDMALILDSDEYVFCCSWMKFYEDCFKKIVIRDDCKWKIWNIAFREMDRPRLWFKPYDIRYGVTHYEMYDVNDETKALINMGGDTYHLIDHIVIKHDPNLRDAAHVMAHERWELKQQSMEDHVRFGPNFEGLKVVKHADEPYIPK